MNTNDVERRLEALADNSARPETPIALFDRLSELEETRPARARLRWLPGGRASGGRRGRLALLGIAAAVALTSSAILAGGATHTDPSPAPSDARTSPASAAPPSAAATSTLLAPTSLPAFATQLPARDYAPPATLTAWRRAYTFSGSWQFGVVMSGGGPSQPILSWQNGEIVGVAGRYSGLTEDTCVLRSKDGSSWTCTPLPTPTGEVCGPGPCVDVAGLAIRDGRWVAVGSSEFVEQSSGTNPKTFLTWTSNDGLHWDVQPRTSSPTGFVPISREPAAGFAQQPTIIATTSGFLLAGCSTTTTGLSALRTSTDGKTWQPVRYAAGSEEIFCAHLGMRAPTGFMASGWCSGGTDFAESGCLAFSADGETWTTENAAAVAGAAAPAGSKLVLYIDPTGPAYVDGRWIVRLVDQAATGGKVRYYEATSIDGTTWALSVASVEDWVGPDQADEGNYHQTVVSAGLSPGYWAINVGPQYVGDPIMPDASAGVAAPSRTKLPSASELYWSATGYHWQPIMDAPPGWPVAVVETPTSLVAIMGSTVTTDAGTTNTYSVWIAPKK